MTVLERILAPHVAKLFHDKGFDLVLPPVGERLVGKGEFGIKPPGVDRIRRVDLVAARWDSEWDLRAVAVECKAAMWAVYDGLGQAVQYQSLFDEVYIATPVRLEEDSIARSTLADLGLGHIRVDLDAHEAYVSVPAQLQRPSRFDPRRKSSLVATRLALGLAFLDHEVIAAERVRYGFWERGLAVWYGEDVRKNIQWNCWHNCHSDELGAGITVQRTEDIRRICDRLSPDHLQQALSELAVDCEIHVWYDAPVPGQPSKDLARYSSRAADANRVISDLRACPSGYRPRLGLEVYFDSKEWQNLTRKDGVDRLKLVREQLSPVMNLLVQCYD